MRSFLICTPRQILLEKANKEVAMGWECSTHGRENSYKSLVENPEGNIPLGRHTLR
jgi:hypothetical protein